MFKNSENLAKIAVGKSLLKEFNVSGTRSVYMDDNTEFQIQLYNNQTEEIGVKVYINNKPMKSLIVLRPAERCWLERYTDRSVKFKFSTYTIDSSEEAKELTEDNGVIKLEFFKRRKENNYTLTTTYPTHTYYDNWYDSSTGSWNEIGGYTTSTSLGNITCFASSSTISSTKSTLIDGAVWPGKNKNTAIHKTDSVKDYRKEAKLTETGRIGDGSRSDQKFETTFIDFEMTPFCEETIKILPSSTKPIQAGDLQKVYCPECGRKLNTKYKFCPYCGTKLNEEE